MSAIDVGSTDDFPNRQMRTVDIGGMEMGICQWDDEFFAFRNRCPHEGAPLCSGFLQSKLSATLAEDEPRLEVDGSEPVVLCPWHRWEFALRDGAAAWPGFVMRTYPVTVDNGRVVVTVGRRTG